MLLFCLHSLQFSNGEPVIYANIQKINLHTSKNLWVILKIIIIHILLFVLICSELSYLKYRIKNNTQGHNIQNWISDKMYCCTYLDFCFISCLNLSKGQFQSLVKIIASAI